MGSLIGRWAWIIEINPVSEDNQNISLISIFKVENESLNGKTMHFSVICTIHSVISTSEVVAPSVAPSVGLTEQLGVWNSAHHVDVLVYRTWMLQTGQQKLNKNVLVCQANRWQRICLETTLRMITKVEDSVFLHVWHIAATVEVGLWCQCLHNLVYVVTAKGGQTAADVCCLKEKHGCK